MWYNLGILYQNLDSEKSRNSYLKAVEINPDFPEAWYNLGLVYHYLLINLTEAEKSYLKAIEIQPAKYDAWGQLGVLYAEQNNLLEAEKYFLQAHKLKYDDYHTLQNIVVTYNKQYDKANVLIFLDKLFSIAPNWRYVVQKHPDFEWLWDDADFLALVQADD